MAKVMIASPNRLGDAAYSGGSWTTALPVSYLATRQQSQVARAVNADARNSWFYASAASAIAAGVLALCNHNLTTAGQVRWRAFSASPVSAVDITLLSGSLPAGLTVTRSGNGTYIGSDGLLKTAGTNAARLVFDPSTGKYTGLLLEPGATNALTWCRDGTNGAWTKSFMTTALTATGIDGAANSATTLTATAGTARISHTHTVGGTPYVEAVYLRRVSGTGAIKLSPDNFATFTTVTLTSAWQRFQVSSSSAANVVGIQIDTSGDVIEMDYAQCELGTVATMPILTTAATASRSAESATFTGLNSYGVNFTAGHMAADMTILRLPTATACLAQITPGANTVGFTCTSGGVATAQVTSSSTSQAAIAGPTLSAGSSLTAAMSWAVNDVRAAFNGGGVTTDSSATMPTGTATSLTLGDASSTGAAILVRRLRLYAAAAASADLTALSGADFEHVAGYDSGLVDAWPAAWVAATTAEQRAGVRGLAIHTPSTAQNYQYWRCDMVDEANPAGYLQAGRVFAGTAWRPTYNMSVGAGLGYLERATVAETFSGAEYFVDKAMPRVARFSLDALTVAEGWGTVLEMQRQLGTSRELLFSWDSDDLANLPRHTFLGRFRTLSALEMPYTGWQKVPIEIKELL